MKAKTVHILECLHLLLHSATFKSSHILDTKSFIRNRVLGFVALIQLQLNQLVKSLSVEMSKALKVLGCPSELSYSKQAFSDARQKLKYSAFVALNDKLIQAYYGHGGYKLYKDKYLLLAVDGSLLQLPESKALSEDFERWRNHSAEGGLLMARCSVLYDVLNQYVLSADIDAYSFGENTFYERHLKAVAKNLEASGLPPKLYLMDRNYPSFQKMIEIPQAGNYYLIRCNATYCAEVKAFIASGQDEAVLKIVLDKKRTAHSEFFRLLGEKTPKSIEVRIARILLPNGDYEYLLTNTDFTIAELKDAYHLRWGVEGLYFVVKDHMQLENFSAKTTEGIKQDFFAKILTANITQLLIEEAQVILDEEQKKRQQTPLQSQCKHCTWIDER